MVGKWVLGREFCEIVIADQIHAVTVVLHQTAQVFTAVLGDVAMNPCDPRSHVLDVSRMDNGRRQSVIKPDDDEPSFLPRLAEVDSGSIVFVPISPTAAVNPRYDRHRL